MQYLSLKFFFFSAVPNRILLLDQHSGLEEGDQDVSHLLLLLVVTIGAVIFKWHTDV